MTLGLCEALVRTATSVDFRLKAHIFTRREFIAERCVDLAGELAASAYVEVESVVQVQVLNQPVKHPLGCFVQILVQWRQ
jgi:hypothetical protein